MITAIVILSGACLFELFLIAVLACALKITVKEIHDQLDEIVPIDTVMWDNIKKG